MQVVDEIYDEKAAKIFGITTVGQVCVMLHSGSRGLGHQIAADFVNEIEAECAAHRDEKKQKMDSAEPEELLDRQLAFTKISSPLGRRYISAMQAAANFAWANRQTLTYLIRQVSYHF